MEDGRHKVKQVSGIRKEKRFYEEQWFWMAITIIVICLTRSVKVIICGNNNNAYKQ
nr:hypothetical protein [uncultured Cellulosilyticum sp.]